MYKALIEQESSNHNIFVTVLLGITVIILGATWWWNREGARKYIRSEMKSESKRMKTKILERTDAVMNRKLEGEFKSFKDDMLGVKADLYRSFGFTLYQDKSFAHAILYWSIAMELFQEIGDDKLVRSLCEYIIGVLEKDKFDEVHNIDEVKRIVNNLPVILNQEKERFIELLKDKKNL